MWAEESVFYQIYPLGFCGAPYENDGVLRHGILKVCDWIEHLEKLHVGAIYFSPVFESDTHGYNTRDFGTIDCRLGTDEDFAAVCRRLHRAGIRVVLDGVFNHVGRGFWAFRDVLERREKSAYRDWFRIDFNGDSPYRDGLYYEGWEGNYDLVKLNLRNPAVADHILSHVAAWIERFDIDGLRLDVAYCLEFDFLKKLRAFCDERKRDFFLAGELLHGDYNRWVNDQMLHSATNYECYKGLYSSFNSMNLFEIAYSLNRQFGSDPWTLYRGKRLLNFVDNHDVSRIASQLTNPAHLKSIYALLFAMPGIPCVYYGSEWGAEGQKSQGDPSLRPHFDQPIRNDLTEWIARLAAIKTQERALQYGDYRQLAVTNRQYAFERTLDADRLIFAVNADVGEVSIRVDAIGDYTELTQGTSVRLDGEIRLRPYQAVILKRISG